MRIVLIFAMAVSAAGQTVTFTDLDQTRGREIQVGDRYEVAIHAAANQPISLRYSNNGRTNWGPIIAWTGVDGGWSISGRFDGGDFGFLEQVWTVGGKLTGEALRFYVRAPCLEGRWALQANLSRAMSVQCDTAEGRLTFSTPSDSDSFRTPDGRVVTGRERGRNLQPEQYRQQYQQGLMESSITGQLEPRSLRFSGDSAAEAIEQIIGVNALTPEETGRVLVIIRAAFAKPHPVEYPTETLRLLQTLKAATGQTDLQREIDAAAASVLAQ